MLLFEVSHKFNLLCNLSVRKAQCLHQATPECHGHCSPATNIEPNVLTIGLEFHSWPIDQTQYLNKLLLSYKLKKFMIQPLGGVG